MEKNKTFVYFLERIYWIGSLGIPRIANLGKVKSGIANWARNARLGQVLKDRATPGLEVPGPTTYGLAIPGSTWRNLAVPGLTRLAFFKLSKNGLWFQNLCGVGVKKVRYDGQQKIFLRKNGIFGKLRSSQIQWAVPEILEPSFDPHLSLLKWPEISLSNR